MTKQEAWVRFMAGALGDPSVGEELAAKTADSMLILMGRRWPEGRGADEGPLVETEDGATREG